MGEFKKKAPSELNGALVFWDLYPDMKLSNDTNK
jgi:hypothetical protein